MTSIVRAVSPEVSEPPAGTWSIFGKIRHLVGAAGGSMADIVKVTIFVTDITQREKVWQARREVFTGNFPASTLVQVAALADPSLKVEIDAVAHIGASRS
jgi:enamine deaminase RidA (YjgF/YER057c/UK114 family)